MAVVDTIRPNGVISQIGWTPSAGSLNSATADDNDATYAEWSGSGSAMVLALQDHALPANHRRHLVRVRVRGQSGFVQTAVRLTTGQLLAPSSANFTGSVSTAIGSWGTGVPAVGDAGLSVYVAGQTAALRIMELYVDVDSREAPDFTPQVLDGGTPTTTVTGTNSPEVRADDISLDDLPPRQYRYWIEDAGGAVVWDTGVVSGTAVTRTVAPLENGSYTLYMQLWSTLGADTPYPSVVESLAFTISTTVTQPPDSFDVAEVPGTPYFDLTVCAPSSMSAWDGNEAYVELQRIDCNGTTRVALAGPIGANECTTYTDWTVHRSLPGTCHENPQDCLTTWRARFVGLISGNITSSDWFGTPNTAIVPGIIVGWAGSAASIPNGWTRATSLDGRYPKGIATNSTEPGSFGGAASHSHTTPGHVHSVTHSHSGTGTSGTPSSTTSMRDNAPDAVGTTATHTHSLPGTGSTTVSSQSAAPGTTSVANELDRALLVWIRATTAADGLPSGAVALMPDISPSGWSTYDDATGRFLRGSAPAADGGGTGSSTLGNHSHDVNGHTHAGTSHTHTSSATGTASATVRSNFSGSTSLAFTHSHSITIGSATTATLASASGGTSGTQTPALPPWINLRVRRNDTGGADIPKGTIALWLGALADIPVGWLLCDGTNGTPNMIDRYPRGATTDIEDDGGSIATHTHTSPSSHTHTQSGHSHTRTLGGPSSVLTGRLASGGFEPVSVGSATHIHSAASTSSAAATGSAAAGTLEARGSEPLHQRVAFIQFDELPPTPPEPVQRTMRWPDGEHLIRALTPDGPLFVSVCGRIEWRVERPFTVNQGVMGSRQVYSSPPSGHDFTLTVAVRSEAELLAVQRILDAALVLVSPADSVETWAAPVGAQTTVVKAGRIRQVTVPMVATGPEPQPEVT